MIQMRRGPRRPTVWACTPSPVCGRHTSSVAVWGPHGVVAGDPTTPAPESSGPPVTHTYALPLHPCVF